ncbi:hypothetical protein EF849_22650, partial [Aeromonas jandaei]|nr:hypothetical protein [Aeromonas jandaei]
MMCNFKFICPQMWWIVDVGFSHMLDEKNLTQAQEKCLDLECQATNMIFRCLRDDIFSEIMDMESSHNMWKYLNEKYGSASNDDDVSELK